MSSATGGGSVISGVTGSLSGIATTVPVEIAMSEDTVEETSTSFTLPK